MDIREIFILSLDALKERKVRSILTILMVMAGSSLLVAVNGFSAGFEKFFNNQFSNLAPNILFVSSVQQAENGSPVGGAGTPTAPKITLNAAVIERLRSLPFIDEIIPSYQAEITLESQGESKDNSVLSIDPQKIFVIAPTLELVDGSSLRQNDPSAMIVAEDVANPPGETTPFISLGQSVRAKYSFVDDKTGESQEESKNFVVTGVMKATGNPTIDNSVIINTNAGNAFLQKSGKFDSLFVVARSSDFVDVVEEEIRSLYGNDIGITTVKAILKTVQEFTAGINAFLLSIAVISLIVGAVGIITTLYTSVIERIREIGTLKALGAQKSNILALFLAEASIIGIMGATLGLLAGVGGGYLLTRAGPGNGPPLDPVYLPLDMISVWLISVGLSILAGLLPAWKASSVTPIEALRPN
ncbi:MAG TPA: FtsX-like permease family protein [Nitrososphaeraceae archaeon]|jgi:putative ABC transport system permease protein|nr:FtsX-like permease family protein [Nitrososphaeraceae archaeon]